jgi:hypothetical protein
MNKKSLSMLFGAAFLAVGILGFVSNPIIGDSEDAIFYSDKMHNIVHIVSGLLFFLIPMIAPDTTTNFMKGFGVIYLALGIWGLVKFGTDGGGELLGFLHVNSADNFLHIGLGLIIFLAGIFASRSNSISA